MMFKAGISLIALAATMPLPVSAGNGLAVLPPGLSQGAFERPSTDPLAAAAAGAVSAALAVTGQIEMPRELMPAMDPVKAATAAAGLAFSGIPDEIMMSATVRPGPKPLRMTERVRLAAEATAGTVFEIRSGSPWRIEPEKTRHLKFEARDGSAGFALPGHEPVAPAPAPEVFLVETGPAMERSYGVVDRLANDLLARYGEQSHDADSDMRRIADIAAMSEDVQAGEGPVRFSDDATMTRETSQAVNTGEALNSLMAARIQQIREMQSLMGAYGAGGYAQPMVASQPQVAAMAAGDGSLVRPVAGALDGVPGLDYRGELPAAQVISANDVPAGSSPFAPAETASMAMLPSATQADPSMIAGMMAGYQAPAEEMAPVTVGHGESLVLRGWNLGLTGSGQIGMYLEGDPNSVIELSEGMVVGGVGEVLTALMEGDQLVARFDSGEELRSPIGMVRLMSTGATE